MALASRMVKLHKPVLTAEMMTKSNIAKSQEIVTRFVREGVFFSTRFASSQDTLLPLTPQACMVV